MIRYDEKFNKEIRSVINKYNRKVRRLQKSDRLDIYIPKKFTRTALKELKSRATSRKDIRRTLEDLSEYTKRGSEQFIEGSSISRAQFNIIKRYNRRLRRQVRKKIRFFETQKPKVLGREEDITFAQMADRDYLNAIAKRDKIISNKDLLSLSPNEIQEYIEYLQSNTKTRSLIKWQNQYLDIILDTAYTYGVPHQIVHDIREKLKDLTPQQFNDLLANERGLQQIIYYYKAVEDLGVDIAYENIGSDVYGLFMELYENLDDIINSYA